jgi:hypothetical protein
MESTEDLKESTEDLKESTEDLKESTEDLKESTSDSDIYSNCDSESDIDEYFEELYECLDNIHTYHTKSLDILQHLKNNCVFADVDADNTTATDTIMEELLNVHNHIMELIKNGNTMVSFGDIIR